MIYLHIGALDLRLCYKPIGSLPYDLGYLVSFSDFTLGEVELYS